MRSRLDYGSVEIPYRDEEIIERKGRTGITSTTRQGIFILFILLIVFIGFIVFKMSMFEIFLIICLAGIILKLTDIEEKIERR